MIKKRILMVGNGNHQLITNYVRRLTQIKKNEYVIDVFSFTPVQSDIKSYYNSEYYINHKNLIYQIVSKIKGIRIYYRYHKYKKLIGNLPKYDIIHVHYVGSDSYFLVEQIKQKNPAAKIILSIWGSDMYGVRPANVKRFIGTCHKAEVLTFANQKSIDYFKSKFNLQKDNIKLCRFGLAPLETLNNLTLPREEYKKLLGWNTAKMAITIGYNLNSAQQHLEILNQFEDKKIKNLNDKIQLILPVTYGGKTKYKNQLLGKLHELPFEYTVYDTFLTDERVAKIRKASDIMIQVQKTDQFSGSMQEHLFARNVVITGSWLPYEIMKEYGVWFIEVDKIAELSNIIPHVINNYKTYEEKTVNNAQAIAALSSWEKNIQNWIDLYNN